MFFTVSTVQLTEKGAQKILPTFFLFILYGKTKLNSLQKLRNKITFKAHKQSSLNPSNFDYFGIFTSKWEEGSGPLTDFKK